MVGFLVKFQREVPPENRRFSWTLTFLGTFWQFILTQGFGPHLGHFFRKKNLVRESVAAARTHNEFANVICTIS